MSSNKKRRELNRAIEEHEIAKLASSSNNAFNAAVWKAGAEKLQADNDQLRSELATLKGENESLRKNAERYRRLRSRLDSKDISIIHMRNDLYPELDDEVYTAIDAAMAQGEQ